MKRIFKPIGIVLNSARATASMNPTLTNYAQGIAADIDTSDADFLAPPVLAPSTIGFFKRWSAKDLLQLVETRRAIGGKPQRISLSNDDAVYNCVPHGLDATVDDAERNAAPDAGDMLDKAKIRAVVQAARRARIGRVLTKIRSVVSATAGLGLWSNPEKDPIAEINDAIFRIAKATGVVPNRLWIDMIAWKKLIDHPKVIARQPGADLVTINTERFAKMLSLNPAMEIKIGSAVYDQNKRGQAKNATFMGAGDVFVFYANQSPDLYDASAVKTFTTAEGGVDQVKTWRDEPSLDVHTVGWSEDVQVAAEDCIERITVEE